jgi:hypothetical protein
MNKVLRHLDTRMGHINDRPSAVSFISSREKLHEVLSGIQDLFNKYPLAGRAAELSPRRRNHLETIGSTFHANFGRD